MLINTVASPQGKLMGRDPLEVFDPELDFPQDLCSRSGTRYPESEGLAEPFGYVNETGYGRSAVSEFGNSIIARLFPNVMCSL